MTPCEPDRVLGPMLKPPHCEEGCQRVDKHVRQARQQARAHGAWEVRPFG